MCSIEYVTEYVIEFQVLLLTKNVFLLFNNILTATQLLEEKGCSFHCYLTDFSLKKNAIIIITTYIHHLILISLYSGTIIGKVGMPTHDKSKSE